MRKKVTIRAKTVTMLNEVLAQRREQLVVRLLFGSAYGGAYAALWAGYWALPWFMAYAFLQLFEANLVKRRQKPVEGRMALYLFVSSVMFGGPAVMGFLPYEPWEVSMRTFLLLGGLLNVVNTSGRSRSCALANGVPYAIYIQLLPVQLWLGGMAFAQVWPIYLASALIITYSSIIWQGSASNLEASIESVETLTIAREELISGRELQERLNAENLRLAEVDHLTRLPNRRLFFSELERSLETVPTPSLVVALVDLDGFKPVNDIFGHAAGDNVLVQAAARLTAAAEGAMVARIGGDEFAVILSALDGEAELAIWAMRTCALLSEPYAIEGAVVHLSGSLGLSGLNGPDVTARQLVERADYALYASKRAEPGGHAIFSTEHDGEVRRTAMIGQGLRCADLEGQLRVMYQPIVDSHDGSTVVVEALARWISPDLGSVPPDEFIAIAENNGVISRLTPLLLKKALADVAQWPTRIRVSFNLSAHDLMSEQALHHVVRAVEESGVAPSRLDFEITETALMSDLARAKAAIEHLRLMGFGVSLDDFGTGHSSLSYVHRLALDKIKIDRSFIQNVETDVAAAGVTKTVIDMCRNLGLTCIVEGVETHDQLLRLRQLGARYMQGYLFARPLSAQAVLEWLSRPMQQASASRSTRGNRRKVA